MSAGCLPCLLSKNSPNAPWLYVSQAGWPLTLQALSPKNSAKFSPSCFLSKLLFGLIFSVHSPVCQSVLCPSLQLQLPPHHSGHDQFPKLSLCISYLLHCGLFSTFDCGVSSARLHIDYLGYLGWFDSDLVVFMGWSEPRVLLLHHHLPDSPQETFRILLH